jgi:hypothetical protein
MSRTYRNRGEHRFRHTTRSDEFRCRHCRMYVGSLPSGGSHRNHCPSCLYSRHVDDRRPGDRASTCGGSMSPEGLFTRPRGEQVILHECQSCGQERWCRVGADDDYQALMRLRLIDPPAAVSVQEQERLYGWA